VQDHHPVTVRQVAEHLARTKGLTRTTALNVMERLREKGYLTREKAGGVYLVAPYRKPLDVLELVA
jgi:predicted transcriptional regulator